MRLPRTIVNLTSTFVLLALPGGARTCLAQAHPLAWSPLALNRIYTLAQGLTNEVVLCSDTRADSTGDSLRVLDMGMVYMHSADTATAYGERCPKGTMVVFHNHPWTGPNESEGISKPVDLCALSRTDLRTAQVAEMPWVAIAVGRGDPKYAWLCWWSKAQMKARPGEPLSTPAVEGQRLKFWSE